MTNESKISKLVLTLTQATVQHHLKWSYTEPPRSLSAGRSDIVANYVEAIYKGQRLAMYERRYKDFDPESESSYWTDDAVLIFLDGAWRVLWEYSDSSTALSNLLIVARESAADVDGIVDKLLE